MAKGKKTGGRDIQKGQVLNPNGRRPDPPELKALRKLSKTDYKIIVLKYLHMTYKELTTHQTNDKIPAIDRMVVSIIKACISSGDERKLEFFLQRLIGKVPDKVLDETENKNLTVTIKKWKETSK